MSDLWEKQECESCGNMVRFGYHGDDPDEPFECVLCYDG